MISKYEYNDSYLLSRQTEEIFYLPNQVHVKPREQTQPSTSLHCSSMSKASYPLETYFMKFNPVHYTIPKRKRKRERKNLLKTYSPVLPLNTANFNKECSIRLALNPFSFWQRVSECRETAVPFISVLFHTYLTWITLLGIKKSTNATSMSLNVTNVSLWWDTGADCTAKICLSVRPKGQILIIQQW